MRCVERYLATGCVPGVTPSRSGCLPAVGCPAGQFLRSPAVSLLRAKGTDLQTEIR